MSTDPEERVELAANRSIYLPAIIVAGLYGGLWLVMAVQGRGDMALARLLLLVVVLGVPLLLARAWLRRRSFGLRLTSTRIEYRCGWLRPRWYGLGFEELSRVEVVYGPLGRLAAGGALILHRKDGTRVRLADAADAEAVARRIRRRLS